MFQWKGKTVSAQRSKGIDSPRKEKACSLRRARSWQIRSRFCLNLDKVAVQPVVPMTNPAHCSYQASAQFRTNLCIHNNSFFAIMHGWYYTANQKGMRVDRKSTRLNSSHSQIS